MADVFISYKRADIGRARTAAQALKAEGYSVFYDAGDDGINVGEAWDQRLERELALARAVIVLWSPGACQSDPVRDEARRAAKRRILCPALIETCEPPLGLAVIETADLRGWNGDQTDPQWRRLIDRGIARKLERAPTGPGVIPAPRRHWLYAAFASVAAIIALVTLLPRQSEAPDAASQAPIEQPENAYPPSSTFVPEPTTPDLGPAETKSDPPPEQAAPPTHAAPAPQDAPAPQRTEPRPRPRRLFDALSVESLPHPDQSPITFPTAYFNRRLQQELGVTSTSIRQIRLGVTFVEPRESRGRAGGGTVIGYVLISLPSLPGCSRQFGGPSYTFDNANTALMSAVNEAAPDIATWIQRASQEETLTCPD